MKKLSSKITILLVCALLGFMFTYEFKLLSKDGKNIIGSLKGTENSETTTEIDQLQKQITDLSKKNYDLHSQLNKYEQNANNQVELEKQMVDQLSDSNLLLGNLAVQGPGIVLTLTPSITDTENGYLGAEELIYLINHLNFAGAEAISINNIRITQQSTITNSSKNILINNDIISPKNIIIIKAIGDKKNLYSVLNFQGELSYQNLNSYINVIELTDNIIIPKYDVIYKNGYLKPVNK
jgi:Uncharacterized protein conserved in bacteria